MATILDDAHLMDLANLRRLRLLFEDFPKNHNLVLIGRTSLLADLGVNQDIKSRVTYSAITKRLGPDAMREFLLRELDRAGLGHNAFSPAALDLVVRSADSVVRQNRSRVGSHNSGFAMIVTPPGPKCPEGITCYKKGLRRTVTHESPLYRFLSAIRMCILSAFIISLPSSVIIHFSSYSPFEST
ncbi:MAG TPA: hypothetical protein VGJ05_05260 [Fimbriiglobus sp.]